MTHDRLDTTDNAYKPCACNLYRVLFSAKQWGGVHGRWVWWELNSVPDTVQCPLLNAVVRFF